MSDALRSWLSRLGSLLLAFLLAVAVWIAATLQVDPFVPSDFTNIPIEFQNQPENTVLFNEDQVSGGVNVRVRAPQSVLAELRVSDFEATMDLASVEPGSPTDVTVAVTCTNEAVRIELISPEKQAIHLEYLRAMTAPIVLDVQGEVATGYQATAPTLTPDFVTIQGPAPYLAEVVTVTGSLNLEGARADIAKRVNVFPVGIDGQIVPEVEWVPLQTEVSIEVSTRFGYKPDVEVVPDIRGDPAPGYRRGSVTVEPSTVTLRGQSAVLDRLPGFVMTLPISITGATGQLTERVPLTVTEQVVVVETNYVTVTVGVLPILSSRTMTDNVEIQGVPPGWIATPSPRVVDVVFEGPDAMLNELTQDNIQVLLSLFDFPLGVHRVRPEVLAPASVLVVSVIPETIEVVLEVAPTPTPTLTLTPTMTAEP